MSHLASSTPETFLCHSYDSFLFLVARFGNTFLLLSRTTNVGHHASKEAGTAFIYLFSFFVLFFFCASVLIFGRSVVCAFWAFLGLAFLLFERERGSEELRSLDRK